MNTFIKCDWLEVVLCGEWNSRCLVYSYHTYHTRSCSSLRGSFFLAMTRETKLGLALFEYESYPTNIVMASNGWEELINLHFMHARLLQIPILFSIAW